MSAYIVALLLEIGTAQQNIHPIDKAIRSGRHEAKQFAPSIETVVAIIEHESHGDPKVCRDEDDGSSSRGLMQINHKDSRCDEEGDRRYARDYDPEFNVRMGIKILAKQHQWHLLHCKHPHDILTHYAGTGPQAAAFARDIRRRAKQLARLKGKHGIDHRSPR